MLTHQYTQHDWAPTTTRARLLRPGGRLPGRHGLFLLGANREQRGTTARHAHGGKGHGPLPH